MEVAEAASAKESAGRLFLMCGSYVDRCGKIGKSTCTPHLGDNVDWPLMIMSKYPETFDLFVDHLYNEKTTLKLCCIVSKS